MAQSKTYTAPRNELQGCHNPLIYKTIGNRKMQVGVKGKSIAACQNNVFNAIFGVSKPGVAAASCPKHSILGRIRSLK
jgi:hypothetical protein